jgi:hypothetical protein
MAESAITTVESVDEFTLSCSQPEASDKPPAAVCLLDPIIAIVFSSPLRCYLEAFSAISSISPQKPSPASRVGCPAGSQNSNPFALLAACIETCFVKSWWSEILHALVLEAQA